MRKLRKLRKLKFPKWLVRSLLAVVSCAALLFAIRAQAQTLSFEPGLAQLYSGAASNFGGSILQAPSPPDYTGPVANLQAVGQSIVYDSYGNLYIADGFSVIRVVAKGGGAPIPALPASELPNGVTQPQAGIVYQLAGNGTTPPAVATSTPPPGCTTANADFVGNGCPARLAYLSATYTIAVDTSGNVFLADNNQIRVIYAAGSVAGLPGPLQQGYIYAVGGLQNQYTTTPDNMPALNNSLESPIGVAVDPGGNIYFAEQQNRVIRVIYASGTVPGLTGTLTSGDLYTVAGQPGTTCNYGGGTPSNNFNCGEDSPATTALLDVPANLSIDRSGNIYISDGYEARIRAIYVSGTLPGVTKSGGLTVGNIYSVVGGASIPTSVDGIAATAYAIQAPGQIAFDAAGGIFIPDSTLNGGSVFRVDAAGTIRLVVGQPRISQVFINCPESSDGFGDNCATPLNGTVSTSSVAVDPTTGDLIVNDSNEEVLQKIALSTTAIDFIGVPGVALPPRSTSVVNTGSQPLVLSAITLPSPFTQVPSAGSGPDCSPTTTLAPGASCTLTVSAPPGAAAGLVGGTAPATVASNATNAVGGQNSFRVSAQINQGPTVTQVVVPSPYATTGQPVTFTATVLPPFGSNVVPTGQVTFLRSSGGSTPTSFGTANLTAGAATYSGTLPTGIYQITASYAGDGINGSFLPSVSNPANLTVAALPVPSVSLTASSASVNSGQSLQLSAKVSSTGAGTPTGAVTFLAGALAISSPIALDSTGVVSFTTSTLPAGQYAFVASYNPDNTFSPATSSPVAVTVKASKRYAYASGNISTIAGTPPIGAAPGVFPPGGGAATSTPLVSSPYLAVDLHGNIYIGDGGNNVIWVLPAAQGSVPYLPSAQPGNIYVAAGSPGNTCGNFPQVASAASCGDGAASTAALLLPFSGISVDFQGNLYILGNPLRKVDARSGIITSVAGSYTPVTCTAPPCGAGGPAASAQFGNLSGIWISPSGDLYLTDLYLQIVWRIDGTTGIATISAGQLGTPASIAAGGGTGAQGSGGDGGYATEAFLSSPSGITGDASGNLFVADTGNSLIRRIDAKTQVITTVAGTVVGGPGISNYCALSPCGDGGPATLAALSRPVSVAVDPAGNLFISDTNDNVIREVDGAGIINTVAGTLSGTGGYIDNTAATSAQLNSPAGIALDGKNNLLIADLGNFAIRLVTNVGGTLKSAQTITFAPLLDVQQSVGSITLTATASSNLPVTYTLSPTSPATLSGSTLVVTGIGTVDVTASQPGNDSYTAAASVTQSFKVTASAGGQAQTITFPPLPALTYGVPPVKLTATSDSGLPVIYSTTGPVQLNGSLLTIAGAGAISVTAIQGGNASYGPATQVTQSVVVAPAQLTVTAGNLTLVAGSQLPGSFPAPTFSGFVNADTISIVSGVAAQSTPATPSSPIGTYPIVVSQGTLVTPNYTPVFVNGTLTIVGIEATTTTLSASPASAAQGATVTLSATVAPVTSGTPTGTVSFYNGTTLLAGGTSTLSAGTATFVTANLPPGTNAISAIYNGDPFFSPSTSSTVTVAIAGPSFTLAANSSSLSVKQGQSGTIGLTVMPVDNYTGTVQFSCQQAPPGVSCSFAPQTLVVSGTNGAQGTVSISTSGLAQSNASPFRSGSSPGWPAALGGSISVACLLFGLRRRRAVKWLGLIAVMVASIAAGMAGCGTSGGNAQAKAGKFVLTVTATDPVLHISQSFDCTVIVAP